MVGLFGLFGPVGRGGRPFGYAQGRVFGDGVLMSPGEPWGNSRSKLKVESAKVWKRFALFSYCGFGAFAGMTLPVDRV